MITATERTAAGAGDHEEGLTGEARPDLEDAGAGAEDHDPHCTCPDCMIDFIDQQGAALEAPAPASPVEECRQAIAEAEEAAGPLADLPFSLTPTIGRGADALPGRLF